ncbi:MAG: hypothetical protein HY692_05885 [Cyanobacteria bacterium NC_groundwater_1444_Ag_S-0.65um_54_12]|nr:hypothetical protein [Cyanobacteria bacterium NC_groundwater_1444_Ag_S-0.65um_54_12]
MTKERKEHAIAGKADTGSVTYQQVKASALPGSISWLKNAAATRPDVFG